MKRIFCLYTGGTIACVDSPNGLIPSHGILPELISKLVYSHIPKAEITLHEYVQPLDSSAMTPLHWRQIASDIASRIDDYDGFVVLHGTDTMAWSGAALHWQLHGLSKPVILTGSQRPWIHDGSDAPANMLLALSTVVQMAEHGEAGVKLAFGGAVLPAHCVKKLDADADAAYRAPNCPPTSSIGNDFSSTDNFEFRPLNPALAILALKLYPGCEDALALMIKSQRWDGLVIESYGSGNLPNHAGLINALLEQAENGCVIINCTQCIAGEVRQGLYAAGSAFQRMGAWPAGRRTIEAATSWLYANLGRAPNAALALAWQRVAVL
ncbi:asparaginase [Chitinibacter sp. S2-10]|uniref:asparaginase n=1 Tax=Chitinibacter sp. S2-10 TaxID=3373597 RepID=UPI003977BA25